ncbi:hypothetical protein AB0E74_04775 [Streptomyces sp. NPDC030392]|uniref:hypothetical protein n=1 Tax=Streptomyces sp. NPDC030392 TaxID=3155468 RepID=UPI0033DDE005
MSVAHCLPLPSSAARGRWFLVVLIVVVAVLSSDFGRILGLAASATAIVTSPMLWTAAGGRAE